MRADGHAGGWACGRMGMRADGHAGGREGERVGVCVCKLLPKKRLTTTKFFVGNLGVQGVTIIYFLCFYFLAQLKQWWIQEDFG